MRFRPQGLSTWRTRCRTAGGGGARSIFAMPNAWVKRLVANELILSFVLKAIAKGETDPTAVAALADGRLRAKPEQIRDALGVCQELHPAMEADSSSAIWISRRYTTSGLTNSSRRWPTCSAYKRAKSSDWQKCPV